MVRRIVLAISLALASGSGLAAPKCSLIRIDEWSVRFVNQHPVVDGTANGQPISIMLDTGSTRSMILHSAARRLDLPRRESKSYRVFGVGGESPVEIAHVQSFSIGATVRRGWQLIVAGVPELGPGVDVILGEDFLRHVDVEFDLAHQTVRLFQAKDCDGVSLAYWTTGVSGEVTIETVYAAAPQIIVPVKVNGRSMRAIVDSGAASSILTKRGAEAAGLTSDSPGVVPGGKGKGLGARSVDTWIGPIDVFTIGNENIRDTTILFGDLFKDASYAATGSHLSRQLGATEQMLLGVDFLRAHRVLIAHSQRKLYFSHLGGPVFQPRGALPAPAAPAPQRDVAPPRSRSSGAAARSAARARLAGTPSSRCRLRGFSARSQPRRGAKAATKPIQIILARQLASSIAAPILLVDAEGTLVYYNESAEAIFNQRFDETGEMLSSEWTTRIAATDEDRRPIAADDRPMMRALADRRPISQTIWLRRPGGEWRHVHVTAFPLIGERDTLFGAMTIFWEI